MFFFKFMIFSIHKYTIMNDSEIYYNFWLRTWMWHLVTNVLALSPIRLPSNDANNSGLMFTMPRKVKVTPLSSSNMVQMAPNWMNRFNKSYFRGRETTLLRNTRYWQVIVMRTVKHAKQPPLTIVMQERGPNGPTASWSDEWSSTYSRHAL